MSVTVVKLPAGEPALIRAFAAYGERVAAGEFTTLVICGFKPTRKFELTEIGERLSRLEMVGLLETAKNDLLDSMEPS